MWINRITVDYQRLIERDAPKDRRKAKKYLRELQALQEACQQSPPKQGKDTLRLLLASGVVRYSASQSALPDTVLPETLMLDFVVDALWPLVVTPKLPVSWLDDLSEITSPNLARLVSHARSSAATGASFGREYLEQALAGRTFAFGIVNLLNDLNDPARGGSSLAAVALASGGEEPPAKGGPQRLIRWVFVGASAAAVNGVIGNRADDLALKSWHWLEDQISQSDPKPEADLEVGHGGGTGAMLDHQMSGNQHHSGAINLIEEFFHNLFRG